jgi:hypothetical protein
MTGKLYAAGIGFFYWRRGPAQKPHDRPLEQIGDCFHVTIITQIFQTLRPKG